MNAQGANCVQNGKALAVGFVFGKSNANSNFGADLWKEGEMCVCVFDMFGLGSPYVSGAQCPV